MSDTEYSVVTAILPEVASTRVAESLVGDSGAAPLTWRARGTLLRDHWWARWMPPIGPSKTMMQLIVRRDEVDRIQTTIIDKGRLHQQATGAVFSTPCDRALFGPDFHATPSLSSASSMTSRHDEPQDLTIICCIVGQAYSERISRAAVNAGAHGPVIYLSEGRGLRDRIGWLRITKEHNQDVLLVLADDSQADDVFDAMANAGELDKPARGIMYRMSVEKGMFNLPSKFSRHRHPASMHQIIHAIDQLAGHKHWRDQGVFDIGSGRGSGLSRFEGQHSILEDRERLTVVAPREQMQGLMDMILDANAPGINATFARLLTPAVDEASAHARINDEYAIIRSIVEPQAAEHIFGIVHEGAAANGIADYCLFTNAVPQIATYVPGNVDYRVPSEHDEALAAAG